MDRITSFVESTREECWTCEANDPGGVALNCVQQNQLEILYFAWNKFLLISPRIWDSWRSRGFDPRSALMLEVLTYEQNPRDVLAIRWKILVCGFILKENREGSQSRRACYINMGFFSFIVFRVIKQSLKNTLCSLRNSLSRMQSFNSWSCKFITTVNVIIKL